MRFDVQLESLRQHLPDLPTGRWWCAVGQRAHTAAMLLQAQGYDVANIHGGYRTSVPGTRVEEEVRRQAREAAGDYDPQVMVGREVCRV